MLRSHDGEVRHITRPTRVGRAPDNDWVLQDPYVSKHHLMLVPCGDRLKLTDRGSRSGTFVGGARVEQAELSLGAIVTIGETRLRLASSTGPTLLLGDSAAMKTVRERIAHLAPHDLSVLILGESGTGKELVARSLHEQSGRRGAFIAVNCGALPRDLIESELFGHERGAFTGAQKRHLGCFGEADGGTLFLDEIAELPLDLQPRLLRALESRSIRPVGGSREVPIDVRVVAATHCHLEQAVCDGRFRQDLYYRLYGDEITLPSLRERPEDIAPLVRHFLAGEPSACTLDDEQMQEVMRYPWPGNVRELRNAVRRAACIAGPRLRAQDLIRVRTGVRALPHQPDTGPKIAVLNRRLEDIERDIYACVLTQTRHNRRAAADMLGVPKSSFCDKLNRFGLLSAAPAQSSSDNVNLR